MYECRESPGGGPDARNEPNYPRTSEGEGETYVVQLVVEATGVADGLAVLVASPEGGGSRLAVGTAGASTSRRAL